MVIALSSVVFIALFGWLGTMFLKNAEETVTLSEAKDAGNVKAVSNQSFFLETSKEEEIYMEIGELHDYFNQLLCWGGWHSVKPDEIKGELLAKHEYITQILIPETKGTLKDDLQRAADGIEKSIDTNDPKDMFISHRIFHDLDVVMNDIVAEDYWGVTETYGKLTP